MRWDLVVIDEAHRLRNQAGRGLAGLRHRQPGHRPAERRLAGRNQPADGATNGMCGTVHKDVGGSYDIHRYDAQCDDGHESATGCGTIRLEAFMSKKPKQSRSGRSSDRRPPFRPRRNLTKSCSLSTPHGLGPSRPSTRTLIDLYWQHRRIHQPEDCRGRLGPGHGRQLAEYIQQRQPNARGFSAAISGGCGSSSRRTGASQNSHHW